MHSYSFKEEEKLETGMSKWEREDLHTGGSYNKWRQDVIWLTSTSTNERKPLNKMNIAANLVKKAGWKCGDTVWLYKSGGMFMLRKEPSDFVLRLSSGGMSVGDSNHALSLTNANFVVHLNWKLTGATEYDAGVDGGDILFKAREVK